MKTLSWIGSILCGILLMAAAPVNEGYEIGDIVKDFRLKNYDGKMVSMADYKDAKGFIVIFDCNTCPYSKAYNSRIFGLNKKYASKGFPVITINPNDPTISKGDSYDEIVKQAKNKNYNFPYLVDETQEVSHAFGATNTPHVFIVQRTSGGLKVAYIGAIDDNSRNADAVTKRYVEDAVDALLDGKEVPQVKTKAIGCTIKWKNS
ncbi:MAG: thioredoxin family protein [Flammeovirgaceae bacterium]|nr:thioredoxin family protein [Flammeovirgaceae bacterium]